MLGKLDGNQDAYSMAELAKALGNKLTTEHVTTLLKKLDDERTLSNLDALLQVFIKKNDLKLTEEVTNILLGKLSDSHSISQV